MWTWGFAKAIAPMCSAAFRNRPRSSRARSRHTTPWQSHVQTCRIPDIYETLGVHRAWGCVGRPGRRTDLHWPTQTRSRGVRQWFGTEESARGGAGCRAWASHPLARPHVNASVNALALGVQWRAWGSASVGWVPDDTEFISSFVRLAFPHLVRRARSRHGSGLQTVGSVSVRRYDTPVRLYLA